MNERINYKSYTSIYLHLLLAAQHQFLEMMVAAGNIHNQLFHQTSAKLFQYVLSCKVQRMHLYDDEIKIYTIQKYWKRRISIKKTPSLLIFRKSNIFTEYIHIFDGKNLNSYSFEIHRDNKWKVRKFRNKNIGTNKRL